MGTLEKTKRDYRHAVYQAIQAENEKQQAEIEALKAQQTAEMQQQEAARQEKVASNWRRIQLSQRFDELQAELRKAADNQIGRETMADEEMSIPDTLEKLGNNEKFLKRLDTLAEQWNAAHPQEKPISREGLREALAAQQQSQQAESQAIKEAREKLEQLDRDHEAFLREKEIERIGYHISEKLHHSEEQKELHQKYGNVVPLMIDVINKELQKNPSIGLPSISRFEEIEAEYRATREEYINHLQSSWKIFGKIPEMAEQIVKLLDEHPLREKVEAPLEAYKRSQKALEDAQEQLAAIRSDNKIPETFTDLRMLPKEVQIQKTHLINQLIEKKLAENPQKYAGYPKSLAEYDTLQAAAAAPPKENISSDKKAKKAQQNEFKKIKAQIKAWFKEYNQQEDQALKKAQSAVKQAQTNLSAAEEALENAAANYNKTLRDQAIAEANAKEKSLLESMKLAKGVYEKHRHSLDTLISKYNRGKNFDKKIDTWKLDREVAKEQTEYTRQRIEAERDLEKKLSSETSLSVNQEVERQKRGLETLLQKENERIKKHNAQIRKDNKEREKLKKKGSEKAKAYWEQKHKKAESQYNSSKTKRNLLGTAAGTMDKITRKYRDMLVMLTDGVIKAELQDALDEKAVIEMELNNKRTTQTAATRVMSGELLETDNRTKIDQQELEQRGEHQTAPERLQEEINELERRIVMQNQKIERIRSQQELRILENHRKIDEALEIQPEFDTEIETKRLAFAEDCYREALGDPTAADYEIRRKVVESRMALARKESQEAAAAAEESIQQLAESLGFIDEKSQKASTVLTESTQKKLDLAVKIGEKVINFLSKRAAEAAGEKEPAEEFSVSQKLEDLKQKLQEEPETEQHVVNSLLEVGKLLYPIMVKKNQELQTVYDKFANQTLDDERILMDLDMLQAGFEMYQLKRAEKADVRPEDFTQDMIRFLDQKDDDARHAVEIQLHLMENAAKSAREKSTEYQEKIVPEKEQARASKIEAANNSLKVCKESEQEIQRVFVKTLQSTSQKADPRVVVSEETLTQKAPIAFLSQLTGVSMEEGMNLDDAMDAFGRIYTNGLSAAAYYDLGNRYTEAMVAGPEAQTQLLTEMTTHAESIQAALNHVAHPEDTPLTEEARRLSGQLLAIEDPDCARLQAVVLDGNSSQKEAYNRHAIMTANSFNDMREEIAGLKMDVPQMNVGDTEGRKKTSFEKLSAAIHTSRKESLTSHRIARSDEKEQKPLTQSVKGR